MNLDLINTPKISSVLKKMKAVNVVDIKGTLTENEKRLVMIYQQAMMVSMITSHNFTDKWLKDNEKIDEINGYINIDYKDDDNSIYQIKTVDTIFKHPKHIDIMSMRCEFDDSEKYSIHLIRLDPH